MTVRRPAAEGMATRRLVLAGVGSLGLAALTGCGGGGGAAPALTVPTLTMDSNPAGLATGPTTVRFRFSDPVTGFSVAGLSVRGGNAMVDTFTRISPREYSVQIEPDPYRNLGTIRVEVFPFDIKDGSVTVGRTARYRFYQAFDTSTYPGLLNASPGGNNNWVSFRDPQSDALWTGRPLVLTMTFNLDVSADYFNEKAVAEALSAGGATISELTRVSDRVYTLKVTPLTGATEVWVKVFPGTLRYVHSPDSRHGWTEGYWSRRIPDGWVTFRDQLEAAGAPWTGDQALELTITFNARLTRPFTQDALSLVMFRYEPGQSIGPPVPAAGPFTVSGFTRVSEGVYTVTFTPPAGYEFAESGLWIGFTLHPDALGVEPLASDTLRWQPAQWQKNVWRY